MPGSAAAAQPLPRADAPPPAVSGAAAAPAAAVLCQPDQLLLAHGNHPLPLHPLHLHGGCFAPLHQLEKLSVHLPHQQDSPPALGHALPRDECRAHHCLLRSADLMLAGLRRDQTLLLWAWKHPAEPRCQAGCPCAGLVQAGLRMDPTLLAGPWLHPAERCFQAGCPGAGELAAEVRAAGCCYCPLSCLGCLACHRLHRSCLCSIDCLFTMCASSH